MRIFWYLIAIVIATTAAGCRRTPDYVIDQERMAQIMADVHVAESVIESNRAQYPTDSSRVALRQAIYERHGATTAQVDTSLMWYGRHLDQYMDVYDRTIEILDDRIANVNMGPANNMSARQRQAYGDSAMLWMGAPYARVNNRLPSQYISFDIPVDSAQSQLGDRYVFRAKVLGNPLPSELYLAAIYDDGMMEWTTLSNTRLGWQTIELLSDSTRHVSRILGNMKMADYTLSNPRPSAIYGVNATVYVDSIQLVRHRLDAEVYNKRFHYRHVKVPASN